MKSYELPLSRWHKVSLRLQGEMNRLSTCIQTESTRELSLTAHATTSQAVVDQMRVDVDTMTGQHRELTAAWVMIRGMLALKNANHGISTKLAEVEGLNFQLGVLRRIHAAEVSKQHGFEDYKAMQPVAGAPDMMGRPRGGVSSVAVRLRSKAEQDELLVEIQRLSRLVEKTQDEINTLNASTRMSLELSDAVATVAALDGA